MQWPPATPERDLVHVENLRVEANIGPDCWGRSRAQPLLISVTLEADVRQAAANDDLTNSTNYGTLAKEILAVFKSAPEREYEGMEELAEAVAGLAVVKLTDESYHVHVIVKAPKLLLHDAVLSLEIDRSSDVSVQWGQQWKWSISDWKVPLLIGMNPPERKAKQIVVIDLCLFVLTSKDATQEPFSVSKHVDLLLEYINATAFLTLEKFTTEVIYAAMRNHAGICTGIAKVSKPSAILGADASAVQVRRNRPPEL